MPLPSHLEPATYWEQRCAILEGMLTHTISVIANYCLPPAAHDDLRGLMRDWDRNLEDLKCRFPPPENGDRERG